MNMQETKPISAYKQGLRSKIIEAAMNAFRSRGIRAVRMDDVAAELKISKRTLYEIFDNKEVLLFEGIQKYYEDRSLNMQVLISHCKNVMEVVMLVFRKKTDEIRNTNPQFYADLPQYPKVAAYLNAQKERNRSESAKFFERGKEEGYFRPEINQDLVSIVFEALNRYVMENRLYQQFTFEELFTNLVFLTLRGICTEKGLQAMDKLLAK